MRKALDLIGLPVMDVSMGKKLGTAKDFGLDEDWNVCLVVLESKSWLADTKYIRVSDVLAFGQDAVTVSHSGVVRSAEEEVLPHSVILMGQSPLRGLPVMTVNGQQLGRLEDVYFHENVGTKVVGLELTEGFISDLREGRRWLPLPDEMKIGEDAIIVPVQSNKEVKQMNLT
ncbi:PRC-barrel domain-containing protein [Paenibacillus larvae]